MAENLTPEMIAKRASNEAYFANQNSKSTPATAANPYVSPGATPDFVANTGTNPTMGNTPSNLNIGNPANIVESNAGYTTRSGQRTASNSQIYQPTEPTSQTFFDAEKGNYTVAVQPTKKDEGLYYDMARGTTNNPDFKPPTSADLAQNQRSTTTPVVTPNQWYDTKSAAVNPGAYTPTKGGVTNIAPELFYDRAQTPPPPGVSVKDGQVFTEVEQKERKLMEAYSKEQDPAKREAIIAEREMLMKSPEWQQAMASKEQYKQAVNQEYSADQLRQREAEQAQKAQLEQASKIDSSQMPGVDYHTTNGTDTIDMYKSGAYTSPYQKIVEDFSSIVATQIGEMKTSTEATIKNLQKRQQIFMDEAEASKARWGQQADRLTGIAEAQRDNQLKSNELKASEDDARYGDRLAIMEDNNSRYMGYLQGKFQAAGMLDGGAGLLLLGKYTASAQMAINDVARERQSVKETYALHSREIMTEYFDSVYKVESTRMENEQALTFGMMKEINAIEGDILKSDTSKNQMVLGALKELSNTQMTAQKESFNEMLQISNQQMEKSKFAYEQLRDGVEDSHWEEQFGFTKLQAERDFGFNVQKFEEDKRQFGLQYAMQAQGQTFDQMNSNRNYQNSRDVYMSNMTGKVYVNGQDTGYSTMDKVQSDRAYDLSSNEANMKNAQFAMEADEKGFDVNLNVPGASTPSYNGGRSVYDPVATTSGGVRFNIATGSLPINGRIQCGEFTNDCLGLSGDQKFGNSIADKERKITTQVPTPGSAFVQATGGQYGHVGLIENTGKFDSQGRPTELNYVDSNYGNNGIVQRGVIGVSYDAKGNPKYTRNGSNINIKGFTSGILPNKSQEQIYPMSTPMGAVTGGMSTMTPPTTKTPAPFFSSGGLTLTKRPESAATSALNKDQKSYLAKISDDIRSEPAYKEVYAVQSGYQNVKVGEKLDNAQGDLAIVNGMAKLLDPSGVVRPEEFKTVEEAQPVFARLGLAVPKFFSGDRLTTEARAQFKGAADAIYKEKLTTAQSTLKDKYYAQSQFFDIPREAIDSLVQVSSGTTSESSGGYQQLKAPDGSPIYVPIDQVEAALKAGAKR